jgi:nitric oxide reductase subunit B
MAKEIKMQNRKLWWGLTAVVLASFAALLFYGNEIYHQAPPIPSRVVASDGQTLFTGQDIEDGQNVWQSMGGQEIGSIWGHGAYVAPDWSADYLHRELIEVLNQWSEASYGQPYDRLSEIDQAELKVRLKDEIRKNTYDPKTGELTVSATRAEALRNVGEHYAKLFGDDPALEKLRMAYAIPAHTIKDPTRQAKLNAFFFWAAWACSTDRPGQSITYTNNWPGESLIDNQPTPAIVVWSILSVVFLLAGIGGLVWYNASQRERERDAEPLALPETNPFLSLVATPSMKATLKYFWVVVALLVTQIGMGALTAHYGVEGNGFFGFPLAKWLPYSVTRTWHLQLGIFWIATAWLATGLFMAPAVSGHEPKYQKLGVNFLFVCLLVIVVGSMYGEWLGVQQRLGFTANFWFGHQGYEYVDLGRFWQIFLFVGLFVWLGLMGGALWPALKEPGENRSLLSLFFIASLAIAMFYGAGLMWGQNTVLPIAEYWRWWVVHLWVEGFFEVFATVVIAFLFTRLGLIRAASAARAALFSSTIFLAGGILGTFHHLYFTGTPVAVLAIGASFSALEIVPLTLVGFEAYETLAKTKARDWMEAFKWPIHFFVAVSFWNLVGAGLFGFLINPPIALYYMQSLNTTPVHGHAALFGVYGMLGIGLMLFCLKGMESYRRWNTKALAYSFWLLNAGLVAMLVFSLLPIGLMQTYASISHGLWYARSAEYLQTPLLNTLRWLRVVGDTLFTFGVLALAWFVIGLKTGWSLTGETDEPELRVASREKTAH